MYFINSQDGKNIETTGGSVTKEKIIESINKAFEGVKIVPASPVETETAVTSEVAADIASPRNERFEQARQHLNEAVQESNDERKLKLFLWISISRIFYFDLFFQKVLQLQLQQ